MNEWRKISLREVIEINPASVGSDFKAEWIEYIDISSVGEGAITESPKVIKLKEAPSRAKRLVSQNDTVISTVRPNRRSMFFAKEPKQNWVLSTGFAVLRPLSEKIEPRFLYASVFNREFTEYLISREKGAAYPAVLPEDIYEAEILLPPLPEQKSIARILSSLDDKIELNRRMNETLEAMARAIFKDWFVDFGPTRAKQEGRAAYLPEHLWSLFPEAIDRETGLPIGWNNTPFSNFVSIVGGGTPKTQVQEYWNGGIPWFSVVDTPPKGSIFVDKTEKNISERGLMESSARLIEKGTTIITARGTVGNLAIAARSMTFNQSCYGLVPLKSYSPEFIFLTAQHIVSILQSLAHGSVFSTITRQTFENVHIAQADDSVNKSFAGYIHPLFAQILSNVRESFTLAELRDRLLPKLMSGEIRVKDAEKLVEEVM